ncbi:10534_t:CDS:2, partial [Gigaspora margarita]
ENKNDKKILRAAYDYCNIQLGPKNKTTTTINNVYIKNEIECSNQQGQEECKMQQETKDHDKIESTETACPRNNLLRKIAIKNIKDKETKINELEINNQKKQEKYDKLSFEYNKMIEKLKTDDDEYRKLKNIKEKIDRDDSDSFC